MSSYNYGYNYSGSGGGKKNKDNDWLSWALMVFLFAIGAWPIALILLFVKLSDSGEKKKQQNQFPPLHTEAAPGRTAPASGAAARQNAYRQSGAGAAKAKSAAKKVTRTPEVKSSNAKWMKVGGLFLALFGVLALTDPVDALFWSSDWVRLWLWDALQAGAMVVGGLGLFLNGRRMDRRAKRYQKYQAVIGNLEALPIDQLSRTLGYQEKTVTDDLQRMIDKGFFGPTAYLNMELGYFFRSSQADADLARAKAARQQAAEPPEETEKGYSGILRNIRRANDNIADPALSAKIDRLEEITAKIFRAVEEDPRKKNRIDTFLNYYLPTTQKLLDSYAEFEATGIEGENLRQAKQRIETTMDSIVAGFEHQLDELYRTDAMDVDSDIRVMETMLGRDTASVERDFGLGRGKRASARESQRVSDLDLGGSAAQKLDE